MGRHEKKPSKKSISVLDILTAVASLVSIIKNLYDFFKD